MLDVNFLYYFQHKYVICSIFNVLQTWTVMRVFCLIWGIIFIIWIWGSGKDVQIGEKKRVETNLNTLAVFKNQFAPPLEPTVKVKVRAKALQKQAAPPPISCSLFNFSSDKLASFYSKGAASKHILMPSLTSSHGCNVPKPIAQGKCPVPPRRHANWAISLNAFHPKRRGKKKLLGTPNITRVFFSFSWGFWWINNPSWRFE